MEFAEAEAPALSAVLAAEGLHRVRSLLLAAVCAAAVLLAALVWMLRHASPVLAEARRSGMVALPAGAVLVLLAGLTGTWLVSHARVRAAANPEDSWRAGASARVPQVLIVPVLALGGAAIVWVFRPLALPVLASSETGFALGGAGLVLAFGLLIGERMLSAASARALPEAAMLRALAFVATVGCFGTGLLEIGAQLGLPYTDRAGGAIAGMIGLVGVELAARAAGRAFLPPPAPDAARGAAASSLARLVSAGVRTQGGLAAPIRQHLGIDFSRSWALAYVRAATLPLGLALGVLAWGLSGVVLVPLDARAVYERFGAPVAVLHPGLHVMLPWPAGVAHRVEFGTVHEIGLTDVAPDKVRIGAEDPSPTAADRLWEQAHAGEVSLVIASATTGKQSFQSVSADIRVLYRAGLADQDALRAAYAAVTPELLVRASAGRVIAHYFADRTLDDVLGADREAMAAGLRTTLQTALDGDGSGIDVVAVAIEAIHPPPGAADAYHNVRAAEISANASIAVERGAAATIQAQSRQVAFAETSNAHAGSAERVAASNASLIRFQADQSAAQAGGPSFLLERYFASLSSALGRSPKTIIDHRLNWPEAPVLDLRPLAAAASATGGKEE